VDSLKNRLLGTIQRKLSQSSACIRIAVKLRNQLNGTISSYLNDGIELPFNGEQWLIDQVAPNARVFFDVGANTGAWSKIFLSRMTTHGKGILFEPSPLAVACLREKLQIELNTNVVEIVQAAVCQQSGYMDFYMEEEAGETSSLIASHSNQSASKISVATTMIDAEVTRLNLEFIDFLKIDAEGYDLQVLRGADICLRDKRIGVIQFEYNAPWAASGSTLASALCYLHGYGYDVYLLKHDGLHYFDYHVYGEYFRYSNFVAIAPGSLEVVPRPL